MQFDPLPSHCLVDHSLAIRVRGVGAGKSALLRLSSHFNDGVLLSTAVFKADADGVIDLCRDAPRSGSYAGVDPMGLFWSRGLVSADQLTTIRPPGKDPLTVTLVAEGSDGQGTVSHTIRRVFEGPGVTSRTVLERGLVGKMYEPAGLTSAPAVLVVGGSGGGLTWSQEMAALLASHGFPALALAYFAAPGLPPILDRIPLEYFGTALEWLAAQPGVDANRLGVTGVSRGGELALLLGATFPAIRAVVGYAPSGILWPAFPASGHGAWTLGGQELPFASTVATDEWDQPLAEVQPRRNSFDWYRLPLENAGHAEKATIPVERINGPILMISGTADALWPATELAEIAARRLRQKGFAHPFEHLRYDNAGHNIAWPHAPTTMSRSVHPVSGELMEMGGTPRGNADARSHSWPKMLAFLNKALRAGETVIAPAHKAPGT